MQEIRDEIGAAARLCLRSGLLAAAVAAACSGAYANPTAPTVVSGQAAFATRGNLLSVTNSPGAIINWQQFSIGAHETTRFIQQSAASAVLNRVTGVDPSRILGTLQSNGRVFLVNPNGILFGRGSQVDVAGLAASSLNLSNVDFLSGRTNFASDAAHAAAVVNQGRITAGEGGRVYLIGSAVDNQGVITAPNGDIVLAAGKAVRVAETAAPGVQVEITAPADRAVNLSELAYGRRGPYAGLVTNNGTIIADSVVRGADGSVVLKASHGVKLEAGSRVSARGPDGGSIVIDAQQDVAAVAGRVEATGSAGRGGRIAIAGEHTGIFDGARVDASGTAGGGTILVGGDFQGRRIEDGDLKIANSQRTYVAPSAVLRADAIGTGDGGKVIVWADEATRYYGSISARGGARGGDGGSVEVSGKRHLTFDGKVDTSAPRGKVGSLLLDPNDLYISVGAVGGAVEDASNPFEATDGTDYYVRAATLQGLPAATAVNLQAGHDIIFQTGLAMPTSAAGSISLNAGNQIQMGGFGLTTAGGNVTMTATGGITNLGPINLTGGAGGILTLNSDAAISQNAAISGTTRLVKQGTGTLTLSATNTYTGTTTVSGGTLSLSGGSALLDANAVTVGAAGTLALQNDETIGSLTSGGAAAQVNLNASTLTSGTTSSTFAGVISGAGGLTKQGAGIFTLSGANTYTGATTVSAGVLNLRHATAAGTVAGGVTVANGAALELQGGITIGNEALSITGTGVGGNGALRNISGNNTWGGTVTLTGGGATIRSDGNTLTLNAASSVTGAGQNLTVTGPGNGLIGGAIATTTGTVTKTGTGTWTLSGANTYTGETAINEGTLAVTVDGALGTIAGGTTVASAGTLALQNVAYNTLETLTLNGGTLSAGTGTSSFANAVTMTASSSVSAGSGAQLTLPNVIGEASAGLGLTKTGAGTVVLSAVETYTGPTTVSAGTLSLGASNRLVDSTNLIINGGIFSIGAFDETFAGVQLLSGSIGGTTGVLTSNSNFDLQAGTVAAIITGGSAGVGVIKSGASTVSLTRANTYAGATEINAGVLGVTVNGALGTIGSGTTVNGAGTLDLRGVAYTSLEPLTLNGGTIAASIGISSFSNAISMTASSSVSAGVGAQLTLLAPINESGGVRGLTKIGAGTVVLPVVEGYTGTTTVNAGTLALGASDVLADTSNLVVGGGTFDLRSFNQTMNGVQLTSGTITGTTGILTSKTDYDLRSGTVSAIITGFTPGVGAVKSGAGTVTLTRANTYEGATAVNAGTLAVTSNDALGTIAMGTIVQPAGTLDFRNVAYSTVEPLTLNGGTVATTIGTSSFAGPILLTDNSTALVSGTQLTLSGVISESGGSFGLTKIGPVTLVLGGDNTYTGVLNVNEGTVALGANDRLDDTSEVVVNGGTFDVRSFNDTAGGVRLDSGTITGGTGVLTSLTDYDLRSGTVSAIIAGGVGLNKTTTGTVRLTRSNLFTGLTTVSAGTLEITSNNGLGTIAAGTLVEGPGTLDLQNVTYSTLEPLTLHGGTVATTTGTSSFAGPVTLTADSTASVTGTELTLSGPIGESGGSFGLTKVGAGTLVFSGTNTYTGVLRVNEGTAALGVSNSLHNSSSISVDGGTFDVRTFNETVGGVQLISGEIAGPAGFLTSLTDYDLRSGMVSANISGSVGVDKTTTGTVILSGSNTYTGTTAVDAGTLVVTSSNALGAITAGTTVANGATLSIVDAAIAAEPVTLNGSGVGGIGALTGTGTASLAGSVTLQTASTIGVATGADSLTLGGIVEGPGALDLIGAGRVTFGATVGATTALAALTQSAATTLDINGGLVRTVGDQTYNGPVTTGGATTLRTTANGDVAANDVFTATAGPLTLDTGAGDATFTNTANDFGTVQALSAGDVSLVDANGIAFGNATLGSVFARALAGNVTLNGTVIATATGNSIVLVASDNFINNTGSAALNPVSGRWLVYSTNPAFDTRGGLSYGFKQYNATFPAPAAQPLGNGFLYSVAPVVTPILIGTTTKTYDATTGATLNAGNFTFGGAIDGDTVVLNNASSGVYDNANVGTGKLVSAAGMSLAGATNGSPPDSVPVYGYQLASTTASGNIGVIEAAPVTVTAANQSKTYGQTVVFAGTEFTSSGLQGGESIGNVVLASAGAAPTAHVAGSPYAITGSGASGGTFNPDNYTITYVNGSFTVNRAPLTVTADNRIKTFGQAINFAGTEFTANGLQNGELIQSVALASAGAAANAPVAGSPYAITPSAASGAGFTPGDYAITYVNGTMTVNPSLLTVATVTANNQTKTYGTTFTFTGREFTTSGLENGDTIGRVVLTSAGAAANAPVSGNPYSIVVSGASGGTFNPANYTVIYENGRLMVTPASLTIRADDKSRVPGVANPPFTATYSGFRLGETSTVLGGALSLDTSAVTGSPAGTYAIVPSGQTSSNYAITYLNGTLTVRPESPVVVPRPGVTDGVVAALQQLGIDDFNREITACLGEELAAAPAIAQRGVGARPRRDCVPAGGAEVAETARVRKR